MTVHLVQYRWRNWMEDTYAFANHTDRNANILANAKEAVDYEGADVDEAIECMNDKGHGVYTYDLEVQ